MPEDVTIGELSRRIEALTVEVHGMRSEITLGAQRDIQVQGLERRVSELEATLTWVVRTVGGLVIAALFALVVNRGGI